MLKLAKSSFKANINPFVLIRSWVAQSKRHKLVKALVDVDTSSAEFLARYENARIDCMVKLVFIVLSGISVVASFGEWVSFLTSAMIFGIFIIIYIKSSFRLWCARMIFRDWDKRLEPRIILFSEFSSAIAVQPLNLWPIKIK